VRRAASTTHHLKDVGEGVVDVTVLLTLEALHAHDDDHVSGEGNAPRRVLARDDDLNRAAVVKRLDDALVLTRERFVVEPDSVFERRLESGVLDVLEMRSEFGWLNVEESRLFLVGEAVGEDVVGGGAALLAGGDEGEDGTILGVLADGEVSRLGHLNHERREVRDVERLKVNLHRERTRSRTEVEDGLSGGAHPLSDVASVGERNAERNDPCGVLSLGGDVTGAGDDDLVSRSEFRSNELNLVGDEETDSLNVLALLPPAREEVPLLRRADDEVSLLEEADVGARLAGESDDLLAALKLTELAAPFGDASVNDLLERLEADGASRLVLRPETEEGELGADGLAATSGGADEDVLVGSVERLEDLGLNLVERIERVGVQRLVLLVVKSGDGERLEVEESRGRGELLGEDEVLEREREASFGVHPAVRDDRDEVVGRERIEHRDGEGDVVVLLGVALTEHELIVEEDDLAVDVFDDDPE
jgi:hypothetical protein